MNSFWTWLSQNPPSLHWTPANHTSQQNDMRFSLPGMLAQVTDIRSASFNIREGNMIALEFKTTGWRLPEVAAVLLKWCPYDESFLHAMCIHMCVNAKKVVSSMDLMTSPACTADSDDLCVWLCWVVSQQAGLLWVCITLFSFIGQHRSGEIAWNLNPLISINNKQWDNCAAKKSNRSQTYNSYCKLQAKTRGESMRPTGSLSSLINFWLQVVVVFQKLLLEVKYVGTCCSLSPFLSSSSSPCCCVIFCRSFPLLLFVSTILFFFFRLLCLFV